MLFDLRINEESLVLPDDFQVDIESFHPFDGSDAIKGAYSIPWTLPDVPVNQKILQHASSIDVLESSKAYDAILYYSGNNHKSGKLIVHEAESDIMSGVMTVDFIPDGLGVDLFEKNLRDLIWETVILGTTTAEVRDDAVARCAMSWPDTPFVYPTIKAETFYGSSNHDFAKLLNNFNIGTGTFYTNSASNLYALSPQIFLMPVLEKVFEGYALKGDFVNDEDDNQLLLFSNFAIDLKENKGYLKAFQTVIQYADPAGGPPVDFINVVHDLEIEDVSNTHNTTTGIYTTVATGWTRFNYSGKAKNTAGVPGIGPKIYIELYDGASVSANYIINTTVGATESYAGYFLINTGIFTGANLNMRVKFTIEVNDGFGNFIEEVCAGECWDHQWEIINTSSANLNVFAKEVNLRNCVPDEKINKFLVELKKLGLCFSVNFFSREVRIDYISRQFNGAEDDWTDRQTDKVKMIKPNGDGHALNFTFKDGELFSEDDELPDISLFTQVATVNSVADLPAPTQVNDYALVLNQNAFYRVALNDSTFDVEWVFWFYNYYDKVFGKGVEDFKTDFSPMVMTEYTYASKTMLVPEFKDTGSSAAFEIGMRKPPLKLMYWKGMRASSSGNYPFATSLNRLYDGSVDGNVVLRFDDETYGLGVKRGLDKWFTALTNNPILHFILTLSESDISDMNFLKSKRIGWQVYAVLQLNTTYKHKAIEVSECKLLKIN